MTVIPRRTLLCVFACLVVASAACQSFSGSDNDGTAAPSGADASSTSTSDAGVDPNFDGGILQNGTFDDGCTGWQIARSEADASLTPIHDGNKGGACRVCGFGSKWYVYQTKIMPVPVGASFSGSVFVRTVTTPPVPNVKFQINVGATPTPQLGAQGSINPNAQWAGITADITTTVTTGNNVSLNAQGTSDGCFDIDDAYLYQTK